MAGSVDGSARQSLNATLERLRTEVMGLPLALDVPGVEAMRQERDAVLRLLDGYLVGRLREDDRPLLVVIGGPTGAGKSTLTNSLIGREFTEAGVLRPTTRDPVLLHNPAQADVAQRLLPQLLTTTQDVSDADGRRSVSIRLTAVEEVPQGLVLLDSPDLDSWLQSNRELAVRMLQVADLWLFVTTGTDYADNIPWELLRSAVVNRVSVATVLNRLRPSEVESVPRHFASMLIEEGLSDAPVLSVPEVVLFDGRIPYQHVQALQQWLAQQGGPGGPRGHYLERAVGGSLDQVIITVRRLIAAAADQVVTDRRLRVELKVVFQRAREDLGADLASGTVARATTSDWLEALTAGQAGGRFKRALGALVAGDNLHPAVARTLRAEVVRVTLSRAEHAARAVTERWGRHPASGSLALDEIVWPADELRERATQTVQAWLDGLDRQLAGGLGRGARSSGAGNARGLAVATLALSAPQALQARPRIAPDATVAELVAHTLAPDSPADLHDVVAEARAGLAAAVTALLDEQQARLAAHLDGVEVPSGAGGRLRVELEALEALRAKEFSDGGLSAVPPTG